MLQGIIFALGACFIWGFIFIVPQFMEGFTPIEIALGRYLFYGIVSLLIFCKLSLQGLCRHPFSIWLKAAGFSVAITVGYYTWVVLAMRFCSAAVCALVLGVAPIVIAFYGNWKNKEASYTSLILPSLLILIGLVMINVPRLHAQESTSNYVIGLVCSVLALSSWSWYVVANSKFLNEHPQVSSRDWTTMIGVSTLFWVFLTSVVISLFFADEFSFHKYMIGETEFQKFVVGCAFLGLLCSWLGAFLWNKSSYYLPVSLAGQLTIFETIFGLVLVYAFEQRLPPPLEALGIMILLSSVVIGIRVFSKNGSKQHTVA